VEDIRCLVVDDISIMRFVLVETLVLHCGLKKSRVFQAASGAQAIKRYEKVKPQIVFLDISMPDMSGIDVVKELIKMDKNAKIVMYTSSHEGGDVVACMSAGAIDYITKPPYTERVVEAVNKILRFSRPDDVADDELDGPDEEDEMV